MEDFIKIEESLRKVDLLIEELNEKEKNIDKIIDDKIQKKIIKKQLTAENLDIEINKIKSDMTIKYKKLINEQKADLEKTKENLNFLGSKLKNLIA